MKSALWRAYDWLQTESAYPNGPMPAATCHFARASRKNWFPKRSKQTLIIGPGRLAEVEAVIKAGRLDRSSVSLLTLFDVEVPELQAAGFSTTLGDMHEMPFATSFFDLVCSSNVLEHAFSPYGALLESRRVLKPKGILYAVVPTFEAPGGGRTPWHVHCMSLEHWTELMNKCGFTIRLSVKTEESSIGPGESYYHFKAIAGTPPTPHDEVLRRLIEARGADS